MPSFPSTFGGINFFMKISKIAYSKTFPVSINGTWEKIYLEADVIEGEDVRQCLYALKKQVTDFHFESNKAAEKEADVKGNILDDIISCQTLKVLESYKMLIKNKPELETAYNNKLKELQ